MRKLHNHHPKLTPRDVKGLAFLVLLIALGSLLHDYLSDRTSAYTDSLIRVELVPLLEQEAERIESIAKKKVVEHTHYELFNFDPNTIQRDSFLKLGFSHGHFNVLENYRKAGGSFSNASDFNKLYFISDSAFQSVRPYILIEQERTVYQQDVEEVRKKKFFPKRNAVDINLADSAALDALYGIGPTFAQRIIKYRELLGGFVSTSQLNEVYGMKDYLPGDFDSLYIRENPTIKSIPLNTCSFGDLVRHPYVNRHLASKIIQARKRHGGFRSLTDLKKDNLLNEQLYSKIVPYISLVDSGRTNEDRTNGF